MPSIRLVNADSVSGPLILFDWVIVVSVNRSALQADDIARVRGRPGVADEHRPVHALGERHAEVARQRRLQAGNSGGVLDAEFERRGVALGREFGHADGPGGIGRRLVLAALRRARARRGDGEAGGARRDRLHGDPEPHGGSLREQAIQPSARHGLNISAGRLAILGASNPQLGRREQFEREAIGPIPTAAFNSPSAPSTARILDCRENVAAHANLGAEFQPLAVLGVQALFVAGRGRVALFGFLGLDRRRGGADLAFKVRGAGLDGVEFGARFVGEFVGNCQLGNPAAFLRLAFAELAQFRLGGVMVAPKYFSVRYPVTAR